VNTGPELETFSPHPGLITFADLSRHTERTKPASEVPEENRFVYLRDGAPCEPAEADERVPIVRVEMMALDPQGKLTTPEQAARVMVIELGPERRTLRRTTMTR
jgi:hypothetical protein